MNPSLRVTAGYLFNDAKVTEFDTNPALVGLYLPQVPKHRGSVGASYSNPRIATVRRRYVLRPPIRRRLEPALKPGETEPGLPPYGVLDLSVSRDFGRNLEVFFGVQNPFDQEHYVQLLPTTTGLAATDQRRRAWPIARLRRALAAPPSPEASAPKRPHPLPA